MPENYPERDAEAGRGFDETENERRWREHEQEQGY
jgi:hypothetical protein